MEIQIKKQEDFVLIKVLKTKLDAILAPSLKSELVLLSGNNEKNILMDLNNCIYCDSSGLSAILVANRLCKNAEGVLILSGLQPAVERLVSVSQLDTVLTIAPTVEDGIEMMKKAIAK